MAIKRVGSVELKGVKFPVYESDFNDINTSMAVVREDYTLFNASDIWPSFFSGIWADCLRMQSEIALNGESFQKVSPVSFQTVNAYLYEELTNITNMNTRRVEYTSSSNTWGSWTNIIASARYARISGNIYYEMGFLQDSSRVGGLAFIQKTYNGEKYIAPCSIHAWYYIQWKTTEYTPESFRLVLEQCHYNYVDQWYDKGNNFISEKVSGLVVIDDTKPINPYEPGGESGEGGGDGEFDDESDEITKPTLPTLSSASTGFTRIYNPTLSQVNALANYLWTDESVIQTIWNHIKQFFENPMDAIIGFNIVPVTVPDGGTVNFKLMYIDTGVSMTVAANQFVDVDCGTLEIEKYYGSALDYSPYTKITCFLPYVGNVSLNVDEVMGRTLHVTYRVDICSGSCVAYVQVDGTVLYQYSGHCAIAIPLTGADFSAYVTSAISVGKLAGAAMIGGAGVAAAVGAQDAVQQTNQVITTTQVTTTQRNPTTGRQITTGTVTHVETREAPNDQSSTQASFSGLTAQNISNTVGQVVSSKPFIEHSGSFSGNSGYLGVRRPFVIIERPNMCMPADYQKFNGFPCMITLQLSSCAGYTRVQQVQLTGLTATNPEQAEILELLKSGVIF